MTATHYLEEVEAYLIPQGIENADRLTAIKTIMFEDIKSWFNHTRREQPNLTWNEIKLAFREKYDGCQWMVTQTATDESSNQEKTKR